jgi:transcriptional regulator with XRE-family HTH domain
VDEVKAFLSSRRAKITPEQAGLHSYNRNRRVPGLRRSEVADLAGVSVEYYAQLERGNLAGVSDSVLDALARALQLDEAERAHLAELARTAGRAARTTRRRPPPAQQVRPNVARILDGMTEVPALVNNGRLDVVAANRLARALFAPMFADPSGPPSGMPADRRTMRGSTSLIPAPATSGSTGKQPPMRPSPSCAPKPAATPTTRH